MNKHGNIAYAAALAAVMSLAGCTAKSGGTVHIASLSPEAYATVRVGDKVDLKVEVDYTLEKKTGTISLVVQKDDNSSLGSVTEKVKEGSGRVTLKHTFTVPETRTVTVFVPMDLEGYNKTMIVDSRTYNIAPRK
ncbi:MAG: hypothetical protein PHV36_08765 [Elusimicrobiales bacterium]|nr:hypothetical protein [Elusimicrobiales bacterium]